jgi:hypothetical protein
MKIKPSFVTLTSAAVLVLGASAAEARMNESQETTAQTQAAKKVALQYQTETKLFNKWERQQARHQTLHRSLPSNMRGQDQLSTPGWSDELPF